jgi:chromosome condensin MukBEF MukE localization factor
MSDQIRSRLIIENPIGDGLNAFRATFAVICEGADLRSPDEAVDRLKREGEALCH